MRPVFSSVLAFSLIGAASGLRAQTHPTQMARLTNQLRPKEFGVQDDTRTVISATSFMSDSNLGYVTTDLSTLSAYCDDCSSMYAESYSTLNLPAGAVIDYIGVNTSSDADAVLGFALFQRDNTGAKTLLIGYSFPPHGWGTDYAGPLNILVPDHVNKELVLNVEQAPSPDFQYFGWVEIWWHRTVSAPPAMADFDDVPTNHPLFQYVEALKASGITGGCNASPPLFCPDDPLTRGQMAVFIAKALGLHWPN